MHRAESIGAAYFAASSDGARRWTASVRGVLALVVLCLVGRSQDAGRNVCPSAVVEGFLLTPEEVSLGVLVEVRSELKRICSQ